MNNKLETISNLFEGSEIKDLEAKDILREIESIPNEKAEQVKLWLAELGAERINEIFNPEIIISRAITNYRECGYSYEWIEAKLKEILNNI